MEVMRPRGPDADGTHGTAGVMLGHRRLKIIDLSEASAQPMVDEELGANPAGGGLRDALDPRMKFQSGKAT